MKKLPKDSVHDLVKIRKITQMQTPKYYFLHMLTGYSRNSPEVIFQGNGGRYSTPCQKLRIRGRGIPVLKHAPHNMYFASEEEMFSSNGSCNPLPLCEKQAYSLSRKSPSSPTIENNKTILCGVLHPQKPRLTCFRGEFGFLAEGGRNLCGCMGVHATYFKGGNGLILKSNCSLKTGSCSMGWGTFDPAVP